MDNICCNKFIELIKKDYPTKEALQTEIINLEAILALPKGTEHFMSDIHGEYEAFKHMVNNCSGVIREKIDLIFPDMPESAKDNFCSLIYYPEEKLKLLKSQNRVNNEWYLQTITNLVNLTSFISSKYTKSKVKKAINPHFRYIIDELLHSKDNVETNIKKYYDNILHAILDVGAADSIVLELTRLIKNLAVDYLHLAGDIYDRGADPDKIVDLLMTHHAVDIEWGNHDVLWIGAACGIPVCVFTALYNNLKYSNLHLIENSYGISIRKLINYTNSLYGNRKNLTDIVKTTLILLLKLEGNIIKRNPEFGLNERLVLNNIDFEKKVYVLNGKEYDLKDANIKGINPLDPYEITPEEQKLINRLCEDFKTSIRLQSHIKFIIDKGCVYKKFNGNLIYHGCIPVTEGGKFKKVDMLGQKLSGKAYFDAIDELIRKNYYGQPSEKERDYMYYLWGGYDSPFTGRIYKTFEIYFLKDKSLKAEPRNPYYEFRNSVEVCDMIMKEFGVDPAHGHIINGHLPVKVKNGEKPIMADGKLIIIDGGFCKAYHEKTGIAGYTLIANSHGLRMKAHSEFSSKEEVVTENKDIISDSTIIETSETRIHVRDTDNGKNIEETVKVLKMALNTY